ncbi:MAG: flagellar filament capping protein FliD [Cycloclasticus sp.]|nr:flagellar filament capping protein FliD [Cycloclasticus sp.]
MSISSPGIGSGVDINSLVTQLVAAEGAATGNRLNSKEAEYLADVSAYGSLKAALSIFQSAVQSLQDEKDFQVRSAESSDSDIFTATADETADVSQYGIEVVQLAQANKLITTAGFDGADAVGAGTLTLTQGANSFSITVDATDTLTDVRDAINAATDNTGLKAAIIKVDDGVGGTEQKLVFTADKTGLDNAITITAVDDDTFNADDSGLSRLVNAQLTEPAVALDGQIKVDGQLVSSTNNTYADVVDGISITANTVGAGETLTIGQDKDVVELKISIFVENYNGLISTFNALSSYDSSTEVAGILLGDAVLRGVQSSIRQEITSSISGLNGAFSTLAELGITTDDEGKLSIDSDKLNDALDSNFDQVGKLFASTNGLSNKLDTVVESYIGSRGTIKSRTDGLQTSIDQITDQREALNRRLVTVEARLLKQFSAMDQIVSSLQNQSNFLTQQLANLPGAYEPK